MNRATLTIGLLAIILLMIAPFAFPQVPVIFETEPTTIEENILSKGRLMITGESTGGDIGNAALFVNPKKNSQLTGIISNSEVFGLSTHSNDGMGVNASSINGFALRGFVWGGDGVGVEAVSLGDGPALSVVGRIEKKYKSQGLLKIYNILSGELVGAYKYTFE